MSHPSRRLGRVRRARGRRAARESPGGAGHGATPSASDLARLLARRLSLQRPGAPNRPTRGRPALAHDAAREDWHDVHAGRHGLWQRPAAARRCGLPEHGHPAARRSRVLVDGAGQRLPRRVQWVRDQLLHVLRRAQHEQLLSRRRGHAVPAGHGRRGDVERERCLRDGPDRRRRVARHDALRVAQRHVTARAGSRLPHGRVVGHQHPERRAVGPRARDVRRVPRADGGGCGRLQQGPRRLCDSRGALARARRPAQGARCGAALRGVRGPRLVPLPLRRARERRRPAADLPAGLARALRRGRPRRRHERHLGSERRALGRRPHAAHRRAARRVGLRRLCHLRLRHPPRGRAAVPLDERAAAVRRRRRRGGQRPQLRRMPIWGLETLD